MKYYLSTEYNCKIRKVNQLKRAMEAAGYKLTHDWLTYRKEEHETDTLLTDVCGKELSGIGNADFLLVLLPGYRGTHTELGIAIAMQKPVIIAGTREEFLNKARRSCPFYYAPLVTRMVYEEFDAAIIMEGVERIRQLYERIENDHARYERIKEKHNGEASTESTENDQSQCR